VRSDDGTEVVPCILAPESDGTARIVLSVADFEARVRAAAKKHRPLLVFDQFEEILTLFEDAEAVDVRRALAEMIARLLREPLPVKVLFSFREDYLGRIKQLLAKCPELVDHALRLGAPSPDELETIIRGPFERFPGRFAREIAPELAERLRTALAERFGIGEVSLSEVQTVCLRLWQSSDPSALLAEKGVQGILEDDLGEALDALPSDLRAAAIALLGEMVTSAGTRNVISAEDLRQHVREDDEEITPQLLDEALDRLERDSKLVRRERRHDLYLYEITSEFLVPWITKRRDELQREQERRRERRRLRVVGLIAGALLIITALIAALAIWALGQRAEAEKQADESRSRELAARAVNVLRADPALSLALARRAIDVTSTEQAENALRQAVLGFRALTVLRVGRVFVGGADISPDGDRAVSASDDGKLRIWDLRTGRVIATVQAHRGAPRAARFTSDGRFVVSAGTDGAVVVTDMRTRRHRAVIRNPRTFALGVALAPDGKVVASGFSDGTVRIASIEGAPRVRVFRGHKAAVFGVALSDDQTRVAGAALDGTVLVWHLRGKRLPTMLRGTRTSASSVSFLPRDNGRLIGTDDSGRIWFWNADTGAEEDRVRADRQALFAARFSPDGRRIAAASEDGTIKIIDAASKRVTAVLRGHSGRVRDVNFDAKGDQVISASEDGTIRTWDPGSARVMPGPVTNASISSNGRLVVAGGGDGTVRIWSVASGRLVARLRGHTERSHATFSPDDRRVLSFSDDGTVRIWRVADGKQEHVFDDHGDLPVYAATFDERGRRIVSGGQAGRIVLRSLKGGPPTVRNAGQAAVNDVSFSPNDQRLLSAGAKGTIKIWDGRRALGPVGVLRGHSGPVHVARFSSDGRRILSAGADGTVRIWNLQGRTAVVLRGHNGAVTSAAFRPTDDRIVTSGIDGTVRIWDPQGGEPLVTLLTYGGGSWSASFSPDGSDVVSSGDDSVRLTPCEVCGTTADVLRLARARAQR
jgi:WD40 repeat protein